MFFSSDASICSTMAFPPFGKSDHVVSQFPLTLCQTHNGMPLSITQLMTTHADWDGLRDHLRDILQEDIFKLSVSAAGSEFCEWVQVGIEVYLSHHKYQVRPHSFPWFSAACAAAIVNRNHFFRLYQQNNSFESKVKFRLASNLYKQVLEAATLEFVNKTKESIISQKLGSQYFWQIINSVLKKTPVNLLYLLDSTAWR